MLTRNFFELAPHTHTHEEIHTLTHTTRLTFDLTRQATRGNAKYKNNSNHIATTNRNIVKKETIDIDIDKLSNVFCSYTSRFLNKSKSSAIVTQPSLSTPTASFDEDAATGDDSDSRYGTGRSRYLAMKERRTRLARSRSSHQFGNEDEDLDEPVSPTIVSPSAYLASRCAESNQSENQPTNPLLYILLYIWCALSVVYIYRITIAYVYRISSEVVSVSLPVFLGAFIVRVCCPAHKSVFYLYMKNNSIFDFCNLLFYEFPFLYFLWVSTACCVPRSSRFVLVYVALYTH